MTSSLITGISWERVHLSLTVLLPGHVQAAESVQFVIVDGKRVFPVTTTPAGGGQYRININVTNFRSRAQVPNGTWRIVPLLDGEAWPPHAGGPSRPRTRTQLSHRLASGPPGKCCRLPGGESS